ncbi:MAG: hypothetical protein J6Y90_02160 [Lachnospiraceae bacterium]|nr:hypothetical protein [Lachnospiraceae bacterium]
MSLVYDFRVFIRIIIVNAIIILIYILFNLFRKENRRNSFLFKSLVMLLCPVIGPVYILFSRVIMFIFFRKPVNLEDVIFSKDRESTLVNAEEEKERNIVSIEDALLISGKEDTRNLLLDVIKRAPRKTLYSISLALDSPDSELSHYAASIIQSETAKVHRYVVETRARILDIEEELQKMENLPDDEEETGSDGKKAEEAKASDVEGFLHEKRKITYRTEAGDRFFAQRMYRLRLSDTGEASAMDYSNGARGKETEDTREFEAYYADISEKLEESKDYSKHKDLAYQQGLLARDGEVINTQTFLEKLTEEMSAAHELLSEIDNILAQKVLTEYDSSRYLDILHEISKLVEKRDVLTEDEIGRNVKIMLEADRVEAAAEWTDKAAAWYPDSLVKYSTRVRLCFAQNDHDGFFKTLNEMKNSELQLDQDMLELVRFFA